MTQSLIATYKGKDLPKVPLKIEVFQHKVEFTEVLSKSVPQVGLQWLYLAEIGVNLSSPLSAFVQISSMAISVLSICITFGKVIYV